MFDPGLNPYISEIEKYRDIIIIDEFNHPTERKESVHQLCNLPIVVDLGCGAGNFLRDYAIQAPGHSFFGFELRYKRLVKGAIKFKKRKIDNIKLIQARAETIGHWFHPNSVKEVHINFPDPWPKKKHRKHRLLNDAFFSELKDLLVADGFLSFKTDHKEYFMSVAEILDNNDDMKVIEYSEDLHESSFNDTNILTEFEALFKNKGYPVYYLKSGLR